MGRCHVKKEVVVVGVTEMVDALVSIHGMLIFLMDVYGLSDILGKALVHCRLGPVDHIELETSIFIVRQHTDAQY